MSRSLRRLRPLLRHRCPTPNQNRHLDRL